jgi:hypothetical protein
MRKFMWAVAAISILTSVGCGAVSSAAPSSTDVTGEAWYTKDKWFLLIPLGTDVYYCPKGGGTCYKADWN